MSSPEMRTVSLHHHSTSLVCVRLVLAFLAPVMVRTSSPAVKTMAPELQEEFCKNFTYGNPVTREFFSPGYPRHYPDIVLLHRI